MLFGSMEMHMLYSIMIYREGERESIKTVVAFSNEEKHVLGDKNKMPLNDKQAVCSMKTFNSE